MEVRAGRFPLFDGFRAVAASLVFVYHAWFTLEKPGCGLFPCAGETAPLLDAWKAIVVGFGAQGVAIFYVISAFLLYRPFVAARGRDLDRPSLGTYAIRRAARIIPAYWVALLILLPTAGRNRVSGLSDVVVNFGFAQIYSVRTLWTAPIPPAWTLCVEVTFYAFLAVWAAFAARAFGGGIRSLRVDVALLSLLGVGAFAWRVAVVHLTGNPTDFQPLLVVLPASMDAFAAGMILAIASVAAGPRLSRWLIGASERPWIAWMLAAAVYAVMSWLDAYDGPISADWADRALLTGSLKVLVAVLVILPAVASAPGRKRGERSMIARSMAWIGLVSYGLYIWHVALLDEAVRIMQLDVPLSLPGFIAVALVAYCASLAVARLSLGLVERPVQRAVSRIGRGKASV